MAVLLQPRRQSSHLGAPIWFIKIALLLLGTVSLASAAWFALPAATATLLSGAPKLWTSLKSWLSPPYLFIAVHLIIAVIWKLSDYQKHWDHWSSPEPPPPPEAEEKPPPPETPENAVKATPFDDSPPDPVLPHPSPDLCPEISPPVLEAKKSVPAEAAAQAENKAAAVLAAEFDENETMEATWMAIMKKSTPRPRKAAAPSALPVVGDSRDEMNRRFEDFIKGKRDQLRLERHESNQRRLLGAIN